LGPQQQKKKHMMINSIRIICLRASLTSAVAGLVAVSRVDDVTARPPIRPPMQRQLVLGSRQRLLFATPQPHTSSPPSVLPSVFGPETTTMTGHPVGGATAGLLVLAVAGCDADFIDPPALYKPTDVILACSFVDVHRTRMTTM
jgi:hypothetical protein